MKKQLTKAQAWGLFHTIDSLKTGLPIKVAFALKDAKHKVSPTVEIIKDATIDVAPSLEKNVAEYNKELQRLRKIGEETSEHLQMLKEKLQADEAKRKEAFLELMADKEESQYIFSLIPINSFGNIEITVEQAEWLAPILEKENGVIS